MRTWKVILSLGFLAAAVVALVILFGLGGGTTLDLSGDGGAVGGPAAAPPDAPAPASGPRAEAGPGRGSVAGRVLLFKDRSPVPDVIVRLRGGPTGFEPLADVTGPAGRFRFGEVPSGGEYEIHVAHGEFAAVVRPGLLVAQGEETDVGTLFLERAVALQVRVVDGSGNAVPEARVAVHPTAPPARSWTPGGWIEQTLRAATVPAPLQTAVADEEGVARITDLPAGYYAITAEAEGYARALQTRLLSPESQDEPVEVRLGRGFSLAGSVTAGEGDPVEGQVVATPPRSRTGAMDEALRRAAEIDEEGAYRLDGLAAGTWNLIVTRSGSPPWPAGTVKVPEIGNWDIDLGEGAELRGIVSDEDGNPIAGAEVRLLVYRNRSGGGFGTTASTDEEGRYGFTGLPTGRVTRFEVLREGFARYPAPGDRAPRIRLEEGEVETQDVTLPTGVALSGTVTRTPAGEPVVGARVLAIPRGVRDNGGFEIAATGERGEYAFGALAPGDYVLVVEGEDCCQPGLPNRWTLMRGAGRIDEKYVVEVEPGSGPVTKDLVVEEGASVAGRVEDSEGNPIPGVTVRLSNDPSGESTLTGADGGFRFTGVPAGEQVFVNAWTTGRWGRSDPFHVPAAGEASGIVVRLGAPGRIQGVVEIADGTAPDGGTAVAVSGDARQQPWVLANAGNFESFPIGPDGTFTIENAPPGQISVIAEVPGYPTGVSEAMSLPEGATRTGVRIRIEPGKRIDGVVVDPEGAPIAEADLSVFFMGRPRFGGQQANAVVARSGADGSFVLPGLEDGTYQVIARKEGLNPAVEQNVKAGTSTNLRLVLAPGGEISGRVTGPLGSPVPEILVRAQVKGGQRVEGSLEDTTGPDGWFHLDGVPDGTVSLTASAAPESGGNWIPAVREGVRVGDTSVRIRLEAGARISGIVREPDGSPAGGATVYVSTPGQGGPGTRRNARADHDGTFEIAGLPPGLYTLQVTHPGGYPPLMLPDVEAGTERLTLVLSEAQTIEGIVVGPDGTPAPGVSVRVMPMPGMSGSSAGANTRRDGTFRARNVAAGSYRLTFEAPGRYATRVLDDVPAGSTGVRVTLSEGLSIAGKLLTPDGEPAARLRIAAAPVEGGRQVQATSDPEGKFTIKALAEGRYRLVVPPGQKGYILHPAPEVEAGKEGLELRLSRGLDIAGRILGGEGRAVPNSWISIVGRNSNWVRTDESGNFRIEGLAPGEYTLRVFAGALGQREVKARAGDTAIQVRME